jgi:hypothetical protein
MNINTLKKYRQTRNTALRAQLQNAGRFRRGAQLGAVMIMDIMIWGSIVLGVMAFILWMKKSGYPAIQGWTEATTVSTNMKKMSDIYSGASTFTGLNNAAVAGNANIFAAKYLPGANVIQNQFGGTVTISTGTTNVTADTMVYTSTTIPSTSCVSMANQLADDVDRITVAGTVVKAIGAAINPGTLNTNCGSAQSVIMVIEKLKSTS